MTSEKAKVLALQVASEAVRSGDREAIADAQVGLSANALQGEDIARQLALAAQLLDPTHALAVASGEKGFAELMIAAWARKDFAAVSFGFAQLSMGVSAVEVAAIDAALAAANGKRRTELRSAADVVAIALEVRAGASSARRDADDRAWRRKPTTRSYTTLERRGDGTLVLAIGTEQVESYGSASQLTTALSSTISKVTPAPSPASPGVSKVKMATADVTSTLPHELVQRLEAAISGEPSPERFHAALNVLRECPAAHALAASALVERFVSLWPPALRASSWSFPTEEWTDATRSLPRKLVVARDRLTAHAEAIGAGRTEIVELEVLTPLDRTAVEALDPLVLRRFPSLRKLGLEGLSEPAKVLRLPAGLRVLASSDLEWAVSRVLEDAPGLERFELRAGVSSALTRLPSNVELCARVHRKGDLERLAQALGGRPMHQLELSAFEGSAADVQTSGLAGGVVDVRFSEHRPGQLEALLRAGAWPKVRRFAFELPARHARMHRRKPPDFTFTRGDVEALAAAPFLAQLESLELTGVLGEDLAEVLVAALVRARPKLTRLALNAGEIGNAALEGLVEQGVLVTVRELELFRCKLKANGFALFVHANAPMGLEKLVLAKNAVAQPALEKFCGWPGLASLKRLDLREVSLSPAQRGVIAASPLLRREAVDVSDREFW